MTLISKTIIASFIHPEVLNRMQHIHLMLRFILMMRCIRNDGANITQLMKWIIIDWMP